MYFSLKVYFLGQNRLRMGFLNLNVPQKGPLTQDWGFRLGMKVNQKVFSFLANYTMNHFVFIFCKSRRLDTTIRFATEFSALRRSENLEGLEEIE